MPAKKLEKNDPRYERIRAHREKINKIKRLEKKTKAKEEAAKAREDIKLAKAEAQAAREARKEAQEEARREKLAQRTTELDIQRELRKTQPISKMARQKLAAQTNMPVVGTRDVKRAKFVKGIIEGRPPAEAAIRAGYCANAGYGLMHSKMIQETLQELMERNGLDNLSLINKHVELLNATKVVSAVVKTGKTGKSEEGQTANESSVDFIDVPDCGIQVKALDMAYKIKGAYQENINITTETAEQRMARILAERKIIVIGED